MANASATVQITSSIKATLDGFNITRVSQLPTIRSLKILTMELCNMTAAVESNMMGGKHGHMYIILSQPDYPALQQKTTRLKSTSYKNPTTSTQSSRPRRRKTSLGTGSCNSNTRQRRRSSVHHPGRSIEGDHSTDGGQHRTRVHRRTQECDVRCGIVT